MKLKTSKKIVSLLIVAMLGISVAACSNKEADKPKEEKTQQTESKDEKSVTTKDEYTYDNNEYLTSISWLEKNMKDNKNLVIIDARSDKDYAKGHIPGAVNVAWQGLSKMEGKAGDKDWGTLQGEEDLSKTIGALGISKDSQVVVYAGTFIASGKCPPLASPKLTAPSYSSFALVSIIFRSLYSFFKSSVDIFISGLISDTVISTGFTSGTSLVVSFFSEDHRSNPPFNILASTDIIK